MERKYPDAWIQTKSGIKFFPLEPHPDDVNITDIAHSLSSVNRFGGHTRKPYSVAQHSVLVSDHCPNEFKLWGLLHDASEAYISDVCRPIKQFIPHYAEIEERLMRVIAKKFGLSWPMPDIVNQVDNDALETEKRDLFYELADGWKVYGTVWKESIEPWDDWRIANMEFLKAYRKLT